MSDDNNAPLSAEERAELEELRAEKKRREAEEQARRDRAELEALRAEQAAAEKHAAKAPAPAAPTLAAPAAAAPAPTPTPEPAPRKSREEMSFGERMVATPELKEGEEIPGMPPAQKILIGLALVAVIAFGIYIVLQ